jgi:hypothetical protein
MGFISRHLTVLRIIALLIAAALGLPASAGAINDASAHATLKGIKAIRLAVAPVKPDFSQDGFTTAQLQTDIEARLKLAGIPVDPQAGECLVVTVTTAKINKGYYAYSIDLDLYQPVILVRTPTISASALTWGVGARVGALDTARLHEIRSEVVGFVDQFISAYLEQNPKK